ncbi:hypothetical protein COBT_001886, partial [Conglomerata obtusa]
MESNGNGRTLSELIQCKSITIGIRPSVTCPEDFKNFVVQKIAHELGRHILEEATVIAEKMRDGGFKILIIESERGHEIMRKRMFLIEPNSSEIKKLQKLSIKSKINSGVQKEQKTTYIDSDSSDSLSYGKNCTNGAIEKDMYIKCISSLNILIHLDRQIYTIELPLYLFVKKKEIEEKLRKIGKENQCLICLLVSFNIYVIYSGKNENVLIVREAILTLIENMVGRITLPCSQYISTDHCKNNSIGVFYISKINCIRAMISSDNHIDLKGLNQEANVQENVYFDTLKFCYLTFYLKSDLEDVLCGNDCYLNYEISNSNKILVNIIGFCAVRIKKCIKDIKILLQRIIKLSYNHILNRSESYEAYIFEIGSISKYKFVTIGTISQIKPFLENDDNKFAMEMEVDCELEDFLCGKKNGKINKICKEYNCDVFIETKTEFKERTIVLRFYGLGLNLFEAINMLENEYPAELCFYLNEKHHRRIIGYGGKNIQKIMKKFGVYIKFMGEDEKLTSGYDGNVIIKTPKRNVENLEKMKEEVLYIAEEPYFKSDKKLFDVNLFNFYRFKFKKCIIKYNSATIYLDKENFLRVYKITEDDLQTVMENKNNVIIRLSDPKSLFFLSFSNYEYEIISSEHWYENLSSNSRLFNGNLIKNYDISKHEYETSSDYKINFSAKRKKEKGSHDDYVV